MAGAERPRRAGKVTIAADLFPYDPNHQTFINVYEGGELVRQEILNSGRRASILQRFPAGSVRGVQGVHGLGHPPHRHRARTTSCSSSACCCSAAALRRLLRSSRRSRSATASRCRWRRWRSSTRRRASSSRPSPSASSSSAPTTCWRAGEGRDVAGLGGARASASCTASASRASCARRAARARARRVALLLQSRGRDRTAIIVVIVASALAADPARDAGARAADCDGRLCRRHDGRGLLVRRAGLLRESRHDASHDCAGILVVAGAVTISATQAPQQGPNVAEIEKVRDNLFMIKGGGGNTAVFITANGVVLVDTKLADWGQAIMDKVKIRDRQAGDDDHQHPHPRRSHRQQRRTSRRRSRSSRTRTPRRTWRR